MNKSRSYNQNKLKIICDEVCDNIEKLLDSLGLEEYKISNKMITMNCPIHLGDNPSAINIYYTGESYRGNWKCRTHNCEEIFKNSIIGFVRGVMSQQQYGWTKDGDTTVTFQEAVDFCLSILDKEIKDIKVSKTKIEKDTFTRIVNNIKSSSEPNTLYKVTKEQVKQSLDIPAKYYINRGYTSEILKKYDIGLCNNLKKEMFNRVVVPVYSMDGSAIVGCSGRSIFDQCPLCEHYHDNKQKCPDKKDLWKYPKWKHNNGFKSQEHLYNYWFAKESIQKTKSIILVESPGNVWRLEEAGIHNSVAIFGSSLSNRQKLLIDCSGAMTMYVLTDNDEAGQKASKTIYDKCHKTYNVVNIKIDHKDVAEMSIDQVINIIAPQIRNKY